MVKKAKPRTRVDSFLDVVRSEIAAGNAGLTAWLKHLETAGGIDALFELEAWIRGLRTFFDPQYLPLRDSERAGLAERSFHHEVEILRQVLQRCERYTLEVARLGQPEKIRFETFIERKSRRGTVPGCNVDQVFEQPTPLDSLAGLEESLRDIRLLVCALNTSAGIDYQVYRSLGRRYERELKCHRFVEMLLSQRLRQQYDQVDNPFLRGILDGIKDYRLKRNAALSFLYLLRLLKYLALVGRELELDHPLRETLVMFALMHEEMEYLADFLRARFLKGRETSHSLRDSVGLIIYSLHMEGGRTQKQELTSVASESDVSAIYASVQNSHGLLRNCLQSSVVALAKALNKQVEVRNVYPSMTDSAAKSQLLRQDLSELRAFLKEMLEGSQDPVLDEIIGRMSLFKEKSLPLLMYKDWADFEVFSDAIVSAASSMESRILLRKFISYIETLIQEVSKRSSFSRSDVDATSGQ
jgi:hypothetical protein